MVRKRDRFVTITRLASLLILCRLWDPAQQVFAAPSTWRAYDAQHALKISPAFALPIGRVTYQLPLERHGICTDTPESPRHLIIGVHGGGRNASGVLRALRMMMTERSIPQQAQYVLLAPQFVYRWNLTRQQRRQRYLYWGTDWSAGGRARNAPMHSFALLEHLIAVTREDCPGISRITIVGHSAGGQFVHRLALLGQLEQRWPTLSIHYIVANPSSYVWLQPIDRPECPHANRYKYGLEQIPPLLLGERPLTQILEDFRAKHVTYLLARGDTRRDEFLDTTCAADAQGLTRFARGKHYRAMLRQQFGDGILVRHRFAFLPHTVGHDATAVYRSRIARRAILGE